MSSRKVNLDSVLRYAKRINKMSKRRIDFGEALTNKTTKSHPELLQIKKLLNDACNRFARREQAGARQQFLDIVMNDAAKKTGQKKISFGAFKSAVKHSNLDKLAKSAESAPAKSKSEKPKDNGKNSANSAVDKNVPKGDQKAGNKPAGQAHQSGILR